MDNVFTVEAKWYEDMWIATSDDIPGLAVEARNLNELTDLLNVIVPELLEENSHLIEDRRSLDFKIVFDSHF